jgi:hypothetical protein
VSAMWGGRQPAAAAQTALRVTRRIHQRRQKQMHVIRHNDSGMQVVVSLCRRIRLGKGLAGRPAAGNVHSGVSDHSEGGLCGRRRLAPAPRRTPVKYTSLGKMSNLEGKSFGLPSRRRLD